MPSLRARNSLSRPLRKDMRREIKERENKGKEPAEKPKTLHPQPWAPSGYTAFKALLSARLCAAIWMHIADCDETFNYWEPTHYLLYGSGFQTWEYSPVYAIRSYAYIWLHALPLKIYVSIFRVNKLIVFYFLRFLLSLICAVCEMYFYRGVCRQFGANTGRLTLWILVLSTGMYAACGAYLPSTFAMYMTMISMGAWFSKRYQIAILSTAASAIVAWPFAAVIGLPIAVDLLVLQKRVKEFVVGACLSGALFLIPVVFIDSHYYGKTVIAPLNIILYNIFSSHGPDIYGIEPWTYYFLNGFLNFNLVFLPALLVLFIAAFTKYVISYRERENYLPIWLTFLGMYVWIFIFFTRPHKEERFLFPIYPLIALAGAVAMDYVQKLWCHMFIRVESLFSHYTDQTGWLPCIYLSLFSLLSLSRTYMLYQGYHGSMDVYLELHKLVDESRLPPDRVYNVCVGKEWYRFPGSLFLYGDNWRLQFVKSEFKGQLPKPYSSEPNATQIIPSHMNDLNLEEHTRYVDIGQCDYLVDLDTGQESRHEPNYSQHTANWTVITSMPFIDSQRSHRILRAFYIPLFSDQHVEYSRYNLLKSNKVPSSKPHRRPRDNT